MGQESIYVNSIQFFMDFTFIPEFCICILKDFMKAEFLDENSIFDPVCTSRFGSLDMCACAIFLRKEF